MRRVAWGLMLSLWIGAGAPVQAAGDGSLVLVCYPGGGTVSARQAEPSMNKMLGVLEKLGGWEAGTFDHVFTAEVDECRQLLAERKPEYVLTSLGLYLEHREAHGLVPLAHHPIYSQAKAGLVMQTRALAKDLAPAVRVNAVAPGSILWPEGEAANSEESMRDILARVPLKRQGTPDDIAGAVTFLALDAPYVTGQILAVDGGRMLNM